MILPPLVFPGCHDKERQRRRREESDEEKRVEIVPPTQLRMRRNFLVRRCRNDVLVRFVRHSKLPGPVL